MASEIETMDDWNEVIARCCPCMVMPVPPEPQLVGDSASATVQLCGTGVENPSFGGGWEDVPCAASQTRFKKRIISYSESRSDQGTISRRQEISYFRNQSGACTWESKVDDQDGVDPGTQGVEFDDPQYTQGGGAGGYFFDYKLTGKVIGDPSPGNYSETFREEYSGASSNPMQELRGEAEKLIAKALSNLDLNGGSRIESETRILLETDCEAISPPKPFVALFTKAIYQWQIPSAWEGTVFKITWDVIFASHEWLAWKSTPEPREAMPAAPTFIEKGKTVTWKGPGTGDQENKSWLAGERFVLEPPKEPGKHMIVNIRYEATPRNPYGTKPQITGEGYDPANP